MKRFSIKMTEVVISLSLFLFTHQDLVAQKPLLQLPYEVDGVARGITTGYGGSDTHQKIEYYALDFNIPHYDDTGKPILSVADGFLTSHYDEGYGNYVDVNHSNDYVSRYAHLSAFKVTSGSVKRGEVIGYVGNTGWSTGAHLHFVLYYKGSSVKPEPMSGYSNFREEYSYLAVPFKHPTGTLIKTADNSNVYVIINGQKLLFPNESVFYAHGLSWSKVVTVSQQEINSYVYERQVSSSEPSRHITFFRDSRDYLFKIGADVYLYDYSQGTKRRVRTYQVMQSWGYDWPNVRSSGPSSAPTGNDFWYRDGTLVRGQSSSAVYMVENGYKRAFQFWEVFTALGYNQNNIIWLPDVDINNNIGFRGNSSMLTADNIWQPGQVIPPGYLSINSTPSGAEVYKEVVGRYFRWPNSQTLTPTGQHPLAPDTYSFVLKKAGYQDGTFAESITSGNAKTADIELKPASWQVTLEAENMVASPSTSGAVWGDYRIIWSIGDINTTVNFPSTGNYDFKIRAKGDYGHWWPLMELRIDGVAKGIRQVLSNSWADYSLVAGVSTGSHKVAIAFINDYYSPPYEDCNLYVDKVVITESGSTPPPPTTIILDETFSGSLGAFVPEIHSNVNAAIVWRGTWGGSNGVVVIDVYSSGQPPDVQLKAHIPVQANVHYHLEFRVMANVARSVQLELCQENDPWTYYGFWQNANINSFWQTYSYDFTSTHTDAQARLTFHAGGEVGSIYLDWVKVAKLSSAKPLLQEDIVGLPSDFILSQNYPNPFNSVTKIDYQLPEDSQVKLEIFNTLGQTVDILVDEFQTAGIHSVIWNGSDKPAGIYFLILQAGNFKEIKKMSLLK